MTEQEHTTGVVVRHVPGLRRYEIEAGGGLAGHTDYRDHRDQRVFFHTEVDEKYSGQGLAARLVRAALDDVRSSGKRVVAVCPYVRSYVARHPEYADLTDPVTPEILQWLDTALA